MRSQLLFLTMAGVAASLAVRPGSAQQSPGTTEAAKQAIQKHAEAFVEAFHKGDAKALAAFWAVDGDYTDQNGRQFKGRTAIEKAFTELFAEHKGLTLGIESIALRFVTPNVAIEDGMTAVFAPEGLPPSRARYTIVHVQKDGQWQLSSVRDAVFVPPSNRGPLRGLEWAVGDWASEGDKGEVERLSVAWAQNENFLTATFATTMGDITVGSATQWIGWDPVAKKVRSWIFDAAGGFGEGAWTRDGSKWVIKTNSVLQDGKKAAATYILSRGAGDTLGLQARDRVVDGKSLPGTKELRLKRVK
jgi:uncharacterized protein (TIGR02246 family)